MQKHLFHTHDQSSTWPAGCFFLQNDVVRMWGGNEEGGGKEVRDKLGCRWGWAHLRFTTLLLPESVQLDAHHQIWKFSWGAWLR